MATIRRRSEWKLGTSGQYERVLGWLGAKDEKPTRPKFYLGRDEAAAKARSVKLEAMWASIESLCLTALRLGGVMSSFILPGLLPRARLNYPVPRWIVRRG